MMPYAVLAGVLLVLTMFTRLGRRVLLVIGELLLVGVIYWFSGRPVIPTGVVARRYRNSVHGTARAGLVALAVAAMLFGPLLVLLSVLIATGGIGGTAAITRSRARTREQRLPIRVKAHVGHPASVGQDATV